MKQTFHSRRKPINVTNSPKLTESSFSTYFLTIFEKLNNGTKNPIEEKAIQYMNKIIPRNLPNINLLLTIANVIKI
jgi:hypothetical protein